jgi:signal transduction histidine kinase
MPTETTQAGVPPSRKWRLEWFLLAALFTIAALAGGVLVWLKGQHDRQAHFAATESVIESGESLLGVLCDAGLNCSTNPTPDQWRAFSDRVESIFAVRKDVQSVSLSRDGVTVFHRQAGGLGDTPAPEPKASDGETVLSRSTLKIGGKLQPVFVLTRTRKLPDGSTVVTEAAVRREAVGTEEEPARRLVSSLFAFSLAVLGLSFLACAAVLSFAVIRDRRREERSRREEHLAFSGVLANGILHDFRNPMSAVRLDAQMLGREMKHDGGPRLERVEELSGRIARTMERMDKIFHEFLFLAKPADEKPEAMDVAAAVRECLDTLGPRLEMAGLTAAFDAPPAPVFAQAYSAAFRRALMNVLVNATQFAPKGSAIRVALASDVGHIQIDVCDDGPGIPPKMREKVFEMFVTGRPEGTGLGLFLARAALQRCGGGIRVAESKRGTDMRIELRPAPEGIKEEGHD